MKKTTYKQRTQECLESWCPAEAVGYFMNELRERKKRSKTTWEFIWMIAVIHASSRSFDHAFEIK